MDEDVLKFIVSNNKHYENVLKDIMKKYGLTLDESIDKAFEMNLFPIKTPKRFRKSKYSEMNESEMRYYSFQEKFLNMCSNEDVDLNMDGGDGDGCDINCDNYSHDNINNNHSLIYSDISIFIDAYEKVINFSMITPKIKQLKLTW